MHFQTSPTFPTSPKAHMGVAGVAYNPALMTRLGSCILVLVGLLEPRTYAQQPEQTKAPLQAQEMEAVVVYGERWEDKNLGLENTNSAASRLGIPALEIPASIETISREEITSKGDDSPLQAVTRATGFASSASPGNGGTAIAARGFSGHGSVMNLFDGTRLYVGAGTVSFPADTWTIERIEILRGPGSVINGVGAIGATINYIPKTPSFDPIASEIALSAGSFGLQRYAIGSGGAITDELAFRFDAVYHSTDGDVDRADETRRVVGASLRYRPVDHLDIRLSIDYADVDDAPYWGTPLVNGEIDESIRDNNYNVRDGLIEYEDVWPRLRIDWQINEVASLRSDTYYLDVNRHWRNVEIYAYNPATNQVDRSSYLEIFHDQEQLGNRTDILFDVMLGEMRNRLSVGGEFNLIDFTHTNNSPYGGSTSVELEDPVPGTWEQGVVDETTRDYTTDTAQFALFIDNHLQINDQFSLVTGVRGDNIDYEREDFARSNGQSAGRFKTEFDSLTWRLGGVYQPFANVSLYAQTSTAVDPIDSIITVRDSRADFDLSEGRQYELGIKQQLWDQRIQYTLAVFDIEKEDLLSTNPATQETEQIGQQSAQGIEFELFLNPIDALSMTFNMALTDAQFDEFVSSDGDLSGNLPRNVPEETANLWLNWQPVENWSVGGGVRYVGERFADNANTVELPSYTVLDASLQWAVTPSLELAVRGKNLTDEIDYVLAPYGSSQWILADGRSFEVSLNYFF